MLRHLTRMLRMALFKKALGRPERYTVKLFTRMIPPEVLQEWKGLEAIFGLE